MKEKKKGEKPQDSKDKKPGGKKKYLIPLVTAIMLTETTEEVMAKCKCEPADDPWIYG
ncbi:MAG: hypothetical protein RDV48_14590 [Candidatus Eremiobacteraeota bacterium]|nr:hypothetical protein [Candidatus Eremiobacteraeota bacterium]